MEKRKDAAGYQHQCFTMMVLLNVIIVLFLTYFYHRIDTVQGGGGSGSTKIYWNA